MESWGIVSESVSGTLVKRRIPLGYVGKRWIMFSARWTLLEKRRKFEEGKRSWEINAG